MKIQEVEINWYEGFANDPIFVLTVDEIPSQDDIVFDTLPHSEGCLYWGQTDDGYVSFLSHNFKNDRGYGGAVFKLRTAEGVVEIKGPWSSRSGVMNQYFPTCVEVLLKTARSGRLSGAVTLEVAQLAAQMAGVTLERRDRRNGEFTYDIVKENVDA